MTQPGGPEHEPDAIAAYLRQITSALGDVSVAGLEGDSGQTEPSRDVPERLDSEQIQPATRIQDILNDPENMAKRAQVPYRAHMPPPGVPQSLSPSFYEIAGISEADVLEDWDDRIDFADVVLREHDPHPETLEIVRELRENLCFIGAEEFAQATASMATRLVAQAKASLSGTRLVAADHNNSSGFVYDAIRNHLAQQQPDMLERVELVELSSPPTDDIAERIRREGITFVDDWSITGRRIRFVMRKLGMQAGADYSKVQLEFICAPDRLLKEGFEFFPDLNDQSQRMRIPVHAQYTFPLESTDPAVVAVTGAHASPLFGFKVAVEQVYNRLRQLPGCNDLEWPLLYSPAKAYGRPDGPANGIV